MIGRVRRLIEKAPPRRDVLEINEAILEVIALLHGEVVKHAISVQTHMADGLPFVQGDRVQLQQVILNLIVNAIEAMRGVADGPRDLLISTRTASSGDVLVKVQDTGPGLDRAKLELVFDDFYTTKPARFRRRSPGRDRTHERCRLNPVRPQRHRPKNQKFLRRFFQKAAAFFLPHENLYGPAFPTCAKIGRQADAAPQAMGEKPEWITTNSTWRCANS